MQRGRKKITWTGGAESHIKALKPHPYMQVSDTPEELEALRDALLPGSLWMMTNPMGYQRPQSGTAMHESPYVFAVSWQHDFPVGTLAVYMGTTRVEEESRRGGHTIRIERHTFLINGIRYLAADVARCFKPVH